MSPPLPRADLDHILEHTQSLWTEMRGQQIFVTGGTGFFGCWLVESFLHANRELALDAKITVLTRNPEGFAAKCPHVATDSALTLHQGDIRSFAFPGGEFAYVIHAATDTTAKPTVGAPLDLLSTITTGTERTLQFAMAAGTQKFLLTSSGAVYGRQPADLTHVPETYAGAPDPLNASSDYAEGKRIAELTCALYQRAAEAKGVAFEAKIARCWAFVGPHLPLDAQFAIGNFIADVMAGRPISIGGDGTPRRSYLYAADLMIWLWTMLFRAPALVPINVGSARDLSIRELAETVASVLAPETTIRVAKEPVPGTSVARYVPSVDRAQELLGLSETVSLEDAIRRTFTWSNSC